MGRILCATRGGEASYRAQDAAIALALERGDDLIFVYVVNTHFLDRTERAVRPDVVAEEMAHMGGFLLAMAQERALAQGVTAETRVRYGELGTELLEATTEEEIDTIVLGRPAGGEGAFLPPELEALATEIREKTGVEVCVI